MESEAINLINSIDKFLTEEVLPIINELEFNTGHMARIFTEFSKAGFFKIYVPFEYGGIAFAYEDLVNLHQLIGEKAGAFGFLQIQSSMACWLISRSQNAQLKESYLLKIAKGELTIGNALSQQRPTCNPLLKVEKSSNGYRLNGLIPFASGANFFDYLVIIFNPNEADESFAIIPFKSEKKNGGSLEVSEVMQPMTMQSINTVSIFLDNYLISTEDVILTWPKQTFYNSLCMLPPSSFLLGTATAALKLIESSSVIKLNENLVKLYTQLKERVDYCKVQVRGFKNQQDADGDSIYADIISLTWKSAQLAILSSGGLGLLNTHSGQRLYREITVWILSRLNPSTIEKWLTRELSFNPFAG